MKKPHIYLGINALSSVSSPIAIGWFDLGVQIALHKDEFHFTRHLSPRTSIDRMRNEAARNAMAFGCDYLWFVDDDMLLSDNTLPSLISCDADIVMARTYIRGYPFKNMSFKKTNERVENGVYLFDLENHEDEDLDGKEVVDCDAIGFACALIKVDLLRKMEPPYFITSENSTEDIYFCLRATSEQNAKIKVDCRVPTGHQLQPEFVCPSNVKQLRAFYESMGVEAAKKAEREDRGHTYLDRIKEIINASTETEGEHPKTES